MCLTHSLSLSLYPPLSHTSPPLTSIMTGVCLRHSLSLPNPITTLILSSSTPTPSLKTYLDHDGRVLDAQRRAPEPARVHDGGELGPAGGEGAGGDAAGEGHVRVQVPEGVTAIN